VCLMDDDNDDPFEGTPFAQARVADDDTDDKDEQATFSLPENSVDLIDLFLDPDIQAARAEAERAIEANAAMTPAAQSMAKVVVGLQSLVKQSQRAQRGGEMNINSQQRSQEIRRTIQNRR